MSKTLSEIQKSKGVEMVASLVSGDEMRRDGEFAVSKLAEYRALIAEGGLDGWRIIDTLLGDDLGAPLRFVQFFVDGKVLVSIPYNKPKRSR